MPKLELPGLIDAHVHLRDPGSTHKEDWHTGTCAALHGGVVGVLDMPNNSPPTTESLSLAAKTRRAAEQAVCDYGLFAGASGDNAAIVGGLPGVVGLKMNLDETYGPLHLEDLPAAVRHFQAWPKGRTIAVHAEGYMVAVAIALGQVHGQAVHLCHIARRSELALVRRAKEHGWDVTCEVTPHHLFLTEDDAKRLGGLAHTKPALGTPDDCQALWESLGVVDAVATDHAPHTLEEKGSPNPPPGVPGLETMLPLLLTAVAEGRLTLQRLVELTSTGPATVYGLAQDPRSRVLVDTDDSYVLCGQDQFTKCGWTPFEGWRVRGRVIRTWVRDALAFDQGRVVVAPGFGRPLHFG
jgi:carbamoyl-phosphate synthase/aspartate carbamoyltransferase/dihydroorotase